MVKLTHEAKSLDWRVAYRLLERVMDSAHVIENKEKNAHCTAACLSCIPKVGSSNMEESVCWHLRGCMLYMKKLPLGGLCSFANAAKLRFLRSYSSISCSTTLAFITID
jgi:hypothetical protein